MLTDQQQQDDAGEDSGNGFPEQQRIALDQGPGGSTEVFRVRVTKIESVLRKALVTFVSIGMHGPSQRPVDPCWNLRVVVRSRVVSQLAELRPGSGFRNLRAIRQ